MVKKKCIDAQTVQVSYPVLKNHVGLRLDLFLMQVLGARSRQSLQRRIQEGLIYLEAKRPIPLIVKRGQKVQLGDQVIIVCRQKKEKPIAFDIPIIFEDNAFIVLNKPAQLPMHPTGGYYFNTLLTILETQHQKKYFVPHRLDKETSGVVVLAKTQKACAHLTQQFCDRQVQKRYLAIAHGWSALDFFSDGSIGAHQDSRIRLKMQVSLQGVDAYTSFQTLTYLENEQGQRFSVIACYPKTGRQHQIRVHLSDLGFPVVGDKLYSLEEKQVCEIFDDHYISECSWQRLLLPRHALHAELLTFLHPLTQQKVSFCAPFPLDLQDFMGDCKVVHLLSREQREELSKGFF